MRERSEEGRESMQKWDSRSMVSPRIFSLHSAIKTPWVVSLYSDRFHVWMYSQNEEKTKILFSLSILYPQYIRSTIRIIIIPHTLSSIRHVDRVCEMKRRTPGSQTLLSTNRSWQALWTNLPSKWLFIEWCSLRIAFCSSDSGWNFRLWSSLPGPSPEDLKCDFSSTPISVSRESINLKFRIRYISVVVMIHANFQVDWFTEKNCGNSNQCFSNLAWRGTLKR